MSPWHSERLFHLKGERKKKSLEDDDGRHKCEVGKWQEEGQDEKKAEFERGKLVRVSWRNRHEAGPVPQHVTTWRPFEGLLLN